MRVGRRVLAEKETSQVTIEFTENHQRSLAVRLWIYQRERFPLLVHGVVIAALSASALGVSGLLTGRSEQMPLAAVVTAFVTLLLFFLQLRIADEFKDNADDLRYRPYRAVPRGLVSLSELGWIGAVAGAIQLALALWLDPRLVWLLILVWGYYGLMSAEFFARTWLKAHPLVYLCSHMLILPLIVLYATACDWLVNAAAIPLLGLLGFLLMSVFNGVVFEIGRKIRAPEDEQVGVETYSALWGIKPAAVAWVGALALSAAAGAWVAVEIGFVVPVLAVAATLLAAAALVAARFLKAPNAKRANAIDTMSGLWILSLLLILGVLPVVIR